MHKKDKRSPVEIVSKTDIEFIKETFPHVWSMSSKELHFDPDARLDFMMSRVKDTKTMEIFRQAICSNRHLFAGRNVIVLNCGIDLLLTLWACKYSNHVYGLETSESIEYLRHIISINNLSERVTLIQGKVQNIELPVDKVDVIISNWMGYSLLFDSKCEELIYARDKWLKKTDGIIFPDRAHLYVIGIENSKHKNRHIDWWRDVNSFNMNAIRKWAVKEPLLQTVDPYELLSDPVQVWTINMYKVTLDELKFRTPFSFTMKRCGRLEGILTFFDVQFTKSHTPQGFTTSPLSEHTNWLQTLFYFDEPIVVNKNNKFYCGIGMRPIVYKSKIQAFDIIMDVFSGGPDELCLEANMAWYRKELNMKFDENANTADLVETKEETVKEPKRIHKLKLQTPPELQRKKQPKPKSAEKKRRIKKKIPTLQFFDFEAS